MSGKPNVPSVGQCTGTAKGTGERCLKEVVYGATVCRMHGGNAPHVLAAAAKRLVISTAPRAAEVLQELLEPTPKDAQPCPLCSRDMPRDEALRHRVATTVLDRSGIGPSAKIEIEATIAVDFLRFVDPVNLVQIDEWLEDAKAKAKAEMEDVS